MIASCSAGMVLADVIQVCSFDKVVFQIIEVLRAGHNKTWRGFS
jgi:hypothetical protein